jgi:hypothetical protein
MNMSNIFDVSLTLPILLFFSAEIFAYDTYDSGTGELSIPLLQVGSTVYSDVVVTIGDLINIEENIFLEPFDVFNSATEQLRIPRVFVGDEEYRNVTVTIGSIVSIGDVTFSLQDDCAIESRKYGDIEIPESFLGNYDIPKANSTLSSNIVRTMNLKDLDAWWAKPSYFDCDDKELYMTNVYIESIKRLQELGVETFSVYDYGKWDDFSKPIWSIDESDFAIPNSVLENIVAEAHKRDMKVFLSWQMNFSDNVSPWNSLDTANLSLDTLTTLLESYENHIVNYARFLESIELDGLAGDLGSFDPKEEPEHRELYVSKTVATIEKIREVFSGDISYGRYDPILDNRILKVIDELRLVLWLGGPLPQGESFSVELMEKFSSWAISRYQSRANEQEATLAFTIPVVWEIYAQSTKDFFVRNGYLEDSFCFEPCAQALVHNDFSMQAIAIEGAMRSISSQGIFSTLGVSAHNYWHTDEIFPTAVGGNVTFANISSSIRNKPAEKLFKDWFQR